MGELVEIWATPNTYRYTHVGTGRSVDVIIPEARTMARAELDEIICWQREWAEKQLGIPKKPKRTRSQQHELGAFLLDVRASDEYRAENLHGRYWEVAKIPV